MSIAFIENLSLKNLNEYLNNNLRGKMKKSINMKGTKCIFNVGLRVLIVKPNWIRTYVQ